MNVFQTLVLLLAGYMLAKHGRRAMLFLAPGLVRITSQPEAAPRSLAARRAGEELAALGFAHLGARREDGPIGGLGLDTDSYAHPDEGAYADVFDHAPRDGGGAWVYFLSAFRDGATVLTANHPRLSRSTETLQTGGLPGSSVQATWSAHRVAVERFAARHGAPAAAGDLESRQALARSWYQGPGARELRRLFLLNFINAVAAVLLIASTLHSVARNLRT
jgi:hypothetical protein